MGRLIVLANGEAVSYSRIASLRYERQFLVI